MQYAREVRADNLAGRASVIDGDTIEFQGKRIRLNGIDAPESWQTCTDRVGAEYRCGKMSAVALDAFLAASRPTTCQESFDHPDDILRELDDILKGFKADLSSL